MRWYPPAIAPFAAIPAADVVPDLDSAVRMGLEHHAYFVGVCPGSLPDGWRFVSRSEIQGERFALAGLQEISGVCTHPNFAGRGHARRLTRALLSRQRRRGVASFLHVSEGNMGARRLYESMGFAVRASLSMCKVERI